MRIAHAFAIVIAPLALVACGDSNTTTDGGTVDMAVAPGADMASAPDMTVQPDMAKTTLVGKWLSSGADVAPLLAGAPFNITKITADFQANTYTVVSTDNANKDTTFTGTWTSTDSGMNGIFNITLNQAMPSVVTSQGIYQIDANVSPARLTYEVAQTQPPIQGVTPPTADKGFGSTAGGVLGMKNVQKFSRQ